LLIEKDKVKIVPIEPDFRDAANALIKKEWAGPFIVSKGHIRDTSVLPGFAAVDDSNSLCGLVTYHIENDECEITTLNSLKENQGIGSVLLKTVINIAKENHCRRVWLITTNDNTHAIRFYQRFGFSLKEVHINSMENARKLKPSIPLVGMDGIPLSHEFEFEIIL